VGGPFGWLGVAGGRRPAPGPVLVPPGGGIGVLCAHMAWEEIAIPNAKLAKPRIRMLIRMAAPPFVSHIIHAADLARIWLRRMVSMKTLLLCSAAALLLSLAGCSSEPTAPQKKAEVKPPEPVTGRYALQQMYIAGRGWAPDIQPIKVISILLPEVKAEPGKAAAWQALFVSASLNKARGYTYSVVEGEGNLHQGVFPGPDQSVPMGAEKPFPMAAIKIDSDAAYQTALTKGAEYDKKNPGKPIVFLLEANKQFPDPSWRVIWGESAGTSNFSIFVDSSTGGYLATIH